MTDTKQILRLRMFEQRQAIPAPQRLAAAQSVANHFADHPYLTYAASFAGYYAIRGELDVLPIFNRMARFGKRMALPFIDIPQQPLLFREWQPGIALDEATHGTKQPKPEQAAFIPEVILVPLLAFDSSGHRLGYGGGYYDRTMEQLRNRQEKAPLFIGVAFVAQEIDHVPAEENDQKLDGILTEEGVSVF
jgi:5-formyltetrahydrofolate cyclo-ligase